MTGAVELVVPTVGRPSLAALLARLDHPDARGRRCVVVDDRPDGGPLSLPETRHLEVVVVRSGGRGPAAARNVGWRRTGAPWICVVDDDVMPRSGWWAALDADLRAAGPDVAAVQADVRVPLPSDRHPTDRERNVSGLEDAAWITADMAIRRRALIDVDGFDERFPRAYREDTDLALRLRQSGWALTTGRRQVDHPVPPAPWSISVRTQRGNADDALMRRLHGRRWREEGQAPPGRLGDHLLTTAAGAAAIAAAPIAPRLAGLAGGVWAWRTARFAWDRIRPGPRDAVEVARMAATSALIPPVAVAWRLRGELRARRLAPDGPRSRWRLRPPDLVLFDRDGTLVHDVPYNGDPARVRPVPGARQALDRLRRRGIPVGLVSNQSGVARGLIDLEQVDAVNARLADLLGPFDVVRVCPHGPDDGCECRKPRGGMVTSAASAMGVDPHRCAVVGDIGADVEAALSVGARPVLVPTAATLAREVSAAPEVAQDLAAAIDLLLGEEGAASERGSLEAVAS